MKKNFCRSVLPLQVIFPFNFTQFKSNNKNFWIWQKCLPISLQNPSQLIFYFMNKKFCRSILPLHWFLNSYFAHFRSIINIFDISIFCPIFFQNIMLQLLFILWKNKVKGAAAPFDFAIYFTSQVHRKEIRKISIFLPIFLQHSMLVFLIEWKKWIKRSGRSIYF